MIISNNRSLVVFKFAPVAQSVEQQPFKLMVVGSIPAGRTNIKLSDFCPTDSAAQSAVRLYPPKKSLSSLLVSLLYQVRTYFQNK